MDIAKVSEKSLRIKSKNSSFIVNPDKKIEEDTVILTEKPQDYSQYEGKIVISGPGEYELSGVSIKGDVSEGGMSFDFLEEGQRLVVLPSVAAAKAKDMDDATAVVVFMNEKADDALSQISAQLIAVVGNDDVLPSDQSSVKKVDKLNLKKMEEYKGFLVHLSK